jgi:hypothetical protein
VRKIIARCAFCTWLGAASIARRQRGHRELALVVGSGGAVDVIGDGQVEAFADAAELVRLRLNAGHRLALRIQHLALDGQTRLEGEAAQVAARIVLEDVRGRGILLRQDPENRRAGRDEPEAETAAGVGLDVGERTVLETFRLVGVGVGQQLSVFSFQFSVFSTATHLSRILSEEH